jgi:alpha-tubulin suppressor-like RCC1 family protein
VNVHPEEGYLTGVQAIGAGDEHSLAVKSDGTAYAWGYNDDCQLGLGEDTCRPTGLDNLFYPYPMAVDFPSDRLMQAIAGGGVHSLALEDNGIVWSWGGNSHGQLGVGDEPLHYESPVLVKNLFDVKAIAAGENHSLALRNDGTVWAWGSTAHGQLGVGTSVGNKFYPVQVKGPQGSDEPFLTDVVAVAAGENHSLAVKKDGTVYAWGEGGQGQLGIHSDNDHTIPYQVHGVGNTQPPENGLDLGEFTGTQEDLATVAAGENHSLAVKSDGTAVYAWGGGWNGQLGINSNNDHTIPYQVHGLNNGQPSEGKGLSNISDVAAGKYFSMALKSDGTAVYAWGGNSYGQIDATLQDHRYPVKVEGGTFASTTPPDEVTGKPEVTQVEPAPGATDVFRRTNLTATFSEEMAKSTLTKENFRLYEISTKKGAIQITNVSVTPDPEGMEVTLEHKPLRKDTEYVAVLTTGVEDLGGNAMATNEFWRFKTGSQM